MHPGRLVRHLRVHRRPGGVGDAGCEIVGEALDERADVLGVVVHVGPRVAALGDTAGDGHHREFVGDDPGPHVFDMSVGYDLAGIRSEKVAGFIDAMHDASTEIERLRPQIAAAAGGAFAEFIRLSTTGRVGTPGALTRRHID